MPKKYKRNKSNHDFNTNYNFVDSNNLIEFKGDIPDFLKRITHLKAGYLKKPKGRNIMHFWWETSESWFLNHGVQRPARKTNYKFDSTWSWIIAKDAPSWIKSYIDEGYLMYFKK